MQKLKVTVAAWPNMPKSG